MKNSKMKNILVTGGAGFIGSHVAEYYAKKGNFVTVFDNLSRGKLLNKKIKSYKYNWQYLSKFKNIKLIKADIRNFSAIKKAAQNAEIIFHTAAQTAVTTSITNPRQDFLTNALGTFNVLESARLSGKKPTIIYCSTNKVYGENVNNIKVFSEKTKYKFEKAYKNGIPEDFLIDNCEHTPYGCSKLAGDIYMQDYARLHGLKIGIFRMSCIYGTRQLGVEDQGWLAWFSIASILNKPIIIYGDGKQVRDVLYIDDLVKAYDCFIRKNIKSNIFNLGGGPKNTLSLLELLILLEKYTVIKPRIKFANWRPSDQKVYISDISKAKKILGWSPAINPATGVQKIVNWVKIHKELFMDENIKKTNNLSKDKKLKLNILGVINQQSIKNLNG